MSPATSRASLCLILLGAWTTGCGGTTVKTVTDRSQAASALTQAREQIKQEQDDAQAKLDDIKRQVDFEKGKLSDERAKVARERKRYRRLQGQVSGARTKIAKSTFSGDGTYVVGDDVEPGTYRAAASSGCYWARLRSLDTSDIIDNNNADGPVVVEILPSDKAIEVARCSTFHKVG